jgi:NADPH:quinone reductase-like Zn-dependent oxidoreductase
MYCATSELAGEVMTETMNAIVQDRYGTVPEEVLRLAEVARPTIGVGEVLVRVRAASVDRGTWHIMTGLPYAIRLAGFGLRKPRQLNPGRSLAGTVEAIGDDVTRFKPGDEVFGTCDGSFAEFTRARVGRLALKPTNLSFEEAAAIPVSGLAALQAVRDKARVQAGDKVLITGAAVGWAPSPFRSPRLSMQRSQVCAAPARWTWSAPSVPTG